MRRVCPLIAVAASCLASCAVSPNGGTLGTLHTVEPDVEEVSVEDSLDRAVESYRRYLAETPRGVMTPEAMRRLADLQIEKEYGIIGDGEIVELPAPDVASAPSAIDRALASSTASGQIPDLSESDQDFEARTTEQFQFSPFDARLDADLPVDGVDPSLSGPTEAIAIYHKILEEYPNYERNDQVLYQMARAYDEVGQTDEAIEVMQRLIAEYPYSNHLDEVLFRRAEYYFTRRRFRDAEDSYAAITAMGARSSYYELALYKLGWSLYKQEFYEEALHKYIALLDYKLSVGYDFDQTHEEDEERRISDTFRVISLSFSNLGGPEVLAEYFSTYGERSYEDRIYSNLGEFYLSKLRYNDAATVYQSFVELHPFHRVAPHFSMRITEVYAEGNFPQLVVESKRDFATRYGLQAEYWNHFDVNDSPDVLSYLKTNLQDLATHYHALYQDESLVDEQRANYSEALRWYREFLTSFPSDSESPAINYQLANLLLEDEDFGEAAREYERTAYDYAEHEQASEAGYAAIFAHREQLKGIDESERDNALLATIASSLRFAETFPDHEYAPVVLGAAADDLYATENFAAAIVSAQRLVDRYPNAELPLRHSAWTVIAHSSLEIEAYADAEYAYTRVLELTPEDDEDYQSFVDNLAASIYKQGEQANAMEDYRAAADHFLRVKEAAPTSEIRASAEYDAAAALIRLEDWSEAAGVLEEFRAAFPDNELSGDATRELAFVYREDGNLEQSAAEYERIAAESDDPELRREALLEAGDLYEQATNIPKAIEVYLRYVAAFPAPLDVAQETRFKVAGMYKANDDTNLYHEELEEIVAADRDAGAARTDRSRFLAAQSALVLSERLFEDFKAVRLVQPFEESLAAKRELMDVAMASFEDLVSYEVSEVTAAATFYIAETYFEFSSALLNSERPTDLSQTELADYELVIEEEAYPFEEQSIDVHESNFELLASGIYNPWVQRSIDRLAVLVPGRYAKAEISSGFIDSIDTYAYRSPNAPEPGLEGEVTDADTEPGEPSASNVEPENRPEPAREKTARVVQGASNADSR
jgi:tetratricopeptide (TPR) repeat protein